MNIDPLKAAINALTAVMDGPAPAPAPTLTDDTRGTYLVIGQVPSGEQVLLPHAHRSFGTANHVAIALAARNPGLTVGVYQLRVSHCHALQAEGLV